MADPAAFDEVLKQFPVVSDTLESPRELRDASGRFTRNHFFVPLASDGYPAIAYDSGRIAVLKRKEQIDYLAIWTRGEPMQAYALPERNLSGPLTLGGRFCAYSDRHFYWVDEGTLRNMDLPPSFYPVRRSEYELFKQPIGRPPFVALEAGAFLPGRLDERPAFLFVEWTGSGPGFGVRVLGGGESYSPAGPDRLLLVGQGRIQYLSRSSTPQTVFEPESVMPGPALGFDGKVIACARTTSGQLELRVYPDGTQHVTLPSGRIFLDLFLFPGFVTLTSFVGQQVEATSWPVA